MNTDFIKTLFCMAKRDWSSQSSEQIEAVLTQKIDSSSWLAMARYYNLSQLIYFNLRKHKLIEKLPVQTQQELKKDYLQTNSVNLAYYSELKQVLETFQANNIKSLALKGAVLVPLIYKDMGLRSFADIDLLIQPSDLEKAQNLLSDRYETGTFDPSSKTAKRCHFHHAYQRRKAPRLSLELHWALFSPTMPLELDLSPFWQDTQTLTMADCRFQAPKKEYLLLHQCLHFSGHYFMSWRDLVDIQWFLSDEESPLDWDFFLEITQRHYLKTRIYYPLFWAGQLLQAKIPLEVLEALEPALPKQQLFQQMMRREGGILNEPAGRKKDLRAVIDLMLLAPHQVLEFFRRLCWPGIAWLSVFPDKPQQKWPLNTLLIFVRGVRLILYICWYLLRV